MRAEMKSRLGHFNDDSDVQPAWGKIIILNLSFVAGNPKAIIQLHMWCSMLISSTG